MPEMDGYITAEWIRINYPTVHVLALSTLDADTAIIKMIKSGAKGYILKDAGPEELKLAFREVMVNGFYYNDIVSRKILSSISGVFDKNNPITTYINFSKNELIFIKLACSEKTYQQIANEMFLSERTIDGYRESLFNKLGISTRVGLVIYAIKNRLVDL